MNGLKQVISEMDKKTIFLYVGGIVGILLLIFGLKFLSNLNVKTYVSYDEVESKMISAAKKYYREYPNYLPTVDGGTSTMSVESLVEGKYLKPLKKYVKNGESCTGKVVVTKMSTDYSYVPYLKCSDYSTSELVTKILEDNSITSSGVGLYNINGQKVFRGEVKNNYVKLNKQLWRVIRIESNNDLVLMSHFRTDTYEWDDRYNLELEYNSGINDYNVSRIKDVVKKNYDEGLLTDKEKTYIVYTKGCVSLRTSSDGIMNECSEYTTEELPIRLLTVDEYLQASIDPNCKSINDRACTNYNYMHDLKPTFWTMTKGAKDSSYIYNISTSGVAESRANTTKQLRYVITLSSEVFYKGGSGLYDDPYILK